MTDMDLMSKSKVNILALFGKSGAGKDTIQKWMTKNLELVNPLISYTTRPPRENEENGVDYFFVTEGCFQNLLFLEETEFKGWKYGTSLHTLDNLKVNVGVFNIAGIRSMLRLPGLNVLPIYVQAPDKVRLKRCLNREKNPNCAEICRRFLADQQDFLNINFKYITYQNISENQDFFNIHKIPEVETMFTAVRELLSSDSRGQNN